MARNPAAIKVARRSSAHERLRQKGVATAEEAPAPQQVKKCLNERIGQLDQFRERP